MKEGRMTDCECGKTCLSRQSACVAKVAAELGSVPKYPDATFRHVAMHPDGDRVLCCHGHAVTLCLACNLYEDGEWELCGVGGLPLGIDPDTLGYLARLLQYGRPKFQGFAKRYRAFLGRWAEASHSGYSRYSRPFFEWPRFMTV
jgi:hypothetical protein